MTASPIEQALYRQTGWRLSYHATQKATAREVTLPELTEACLRPDLTYPAPGYGGERWLYTHHDVRIVVNPHTKTVITVLYRCHQPWTDEDMRRRRAAA